MGSDNHEGDVKGMNRRDFMVAGAAGAALAAGAGIAPAMAQPKPPDPKNLRTNSPSGKRVAIVTDTQLNIGPYLAQEFAKLGYVGRAATLARGAR